MYVDGFTSFGMSHGDVNATRAWKSAQVKSMYATTQHEPTHNKNNSKITMVKVFYEPPPFGPRSALNRSPYGSGVNGGSMLVRRMSTLPPAMVITGAVSFMAVLAYLPLSTFVRGCEM